MLQAFDKLMDVGLPSRQDDIGHRHLSAAVAVGNVIAQTSREQRGFLRDRGRLVAQPSCMQFAERLAVVKLNTGRRSDVRNVGYGVAGFV